MLLGHMTGTWSYNSYWLVTHCDLEWLLLWLICMWLGYDSEWLELPVYIPRSKEDSSHKLKLVNTTCVFPLDSCAWAPEPPLTLSQTFVPWTTGQLCWLITQISYHMAQPTDSEKPTMCHCTWMAWHSCLQLERFSKGCLQKNCL
jgi:hypothetical protein